MQADEKKYILILDPSSTWGKEAESYLTRAGFWCTLCTSLTQALLEVQTRPPALLLLPTRVNNLSVTEILDQFKRDNPYGYLVAVGAFTANEFEEPLNWANLPLDDYVRLPLQEKDFSARIALALIRAERDLFTNPLTGLPGNEAIMRELYRRLGERQSFAVGHADLDFFKPFNDKYGFARGDEIIKATARLLVNTVREIAGKHGFVAHIGGDDFFFISPYESSAAICKNFIERFDALIPSFYDEEDYRRGYIVSTDRQGNILRFPFLTVSIAVVPVTPDRFQHVGEIAACLAEVKKQAKGSTGSTFLIDRRKGGAHATDTQ